MEEKERGNVAKYVNEGTDRNEFHCCRRLTKGSEKRPVKRDSKTFYSTRANVKQLLPPILYEPSTIY